MKKIMLVTGTRPQIIKSVTIIHKLVDRLDVQFQFVHTGQHYDNSLFSDFISEFNLPVPYDLGCGGDDFIIVGNIILNPLKAIVILLIFFLPRSEA